MKFSPNLPIKRKLVVITMLVSGLALLVACGAFILYEQAAARQQMARTLDITAAMTAANSTAGLSFDEPDSVQEALKSLSAQPDIIRACVYDDAGRPFARFTRAGIPQELAPPPAEGAGHRFEHGRLELFHPINLAGENIGVIYLEEDMSQLSTRLWHYLLIGSLVWLLSAGVAFFLSARLQNVISEPLSNLAQAVVAVRARNYAVRVARPGNDELGSLIDGFNEMLAQIQERDANLEQRVAGRTRELGESLSVLNTTLDSTADGILLVNTEGKKIFQNRRTVELWKISPEVAWNHNGEFQLDQVAGVTSDPAKFAERIAHYRTHPDEKGQDEIQLKDGTIMERLTAPVLDTEGRNCGRIWSFRDVTQSRKYEAALRESKARFQFIFESVPVGIASRMVHPGGRAAREVNDAFLRICGLTRGQHDVPGIYEKLSHPEDFARQENFMRFVNEGKLNQFSMEKRYQRLDGTTVWVSFSYQRQHYADGSFEELTTIVDITESKNAEAALRESEANYYSLVDQMPAGIFRKDKEGRYVFVNSAFCRFKASKPEDFLGKLPQEITPQVASGPGGTAADVVVVTTAGLEHHALILETGQKIEGDEKYCWADGSITHFHAVKSPVFGPDGAVVGSQGILMDVTQSKQAEAALAYERDLLRTLLDNSTDAIYFKDAQSKFIKSSNAQARQFGLASVEEMVGKSDFDFFNEDHARPAFEEEQEIIRTGQPIIGKVERESWKDGRNESWVLTTKMPLRNKAGEIIGTFGISKDITAIKQTEAALAYERDLLRTLLENSTDAIYFKDTQSRFIKSSDALAHQFGLAAAEKLVGKSDFDFFTEEHARPAFEEEQEIIRTGQPMIGKIERESWKDGRSESWVLTTKTPLRNKAGEIIGTFGISKDVTQMKQVEAELAYERDLLEALLDQSPDCIFFKDRESRYVKLSRSELENLFRVAHDCHLALPPTDGTEGVPEHLADLKQFQKYVIGRSDADIYGPERAGEFGQDEQEILRTGKPLLGKIEKTADSDGRTVWFLMAKSPWHNTAGEIIGTFGTSRNITELKEAEAKVQQAHQQLLETSRLAGMAEVATSVLHNVGNVLNSVNVSTTLVLELVKKSRLNNLSRLATLIHDQRESLAAFFTTDPRGTQLPGYLTKLAEHLAAEQLELVREIELTRKNIEHIKDIVTMQQSYAKVSGVVEKVKVTDLVEDALRMNAVALTRHNVEVVRDYPAEPVECNVERQKVLQILINLIRNAKYACDESARPDKQLIMRVRFGSDRAQITVQDNGVGIPAENMTRIFNHGFTTRESGHGFGLHSGALAAKELGGSLLAYSDGPGAGARFVLDLPLQHPDNL